MRYTFKSTCRSSLQLMSVRWKLKAEPQEYSRGLKNGRRWEIDDKGNPGSLRNKNWHYEKSQTFRSYGELDKVYASNDHPDFTAIARHNEVPSRRVLERMSNYLGLERDHKKLNENPLLRHSSSVSLDIRRINRSVSLFPPVITSNENGIRVRFLFVSPGNTIKSFLFSL